MADSWEDWENEEVVVPGLPAAPAAADPVKSKFAGEDEGDEEEPKWKANVPAPQQASCRQQAVAQQAVSATADGSRTRHPGCLDPATPPRVKEKKGLSTNLPFPCRPRRRRG
jgi:hypothetical protein